MNEDYQEYIEQIEDIFPFRVAKVDIHNGGDDFLVFEINSELMFRFPRNASSQKALEKEMRFLARLKGSASLQVPDYQYVGNGFAGYTKIPGMPLSVELFQSLSKANQEKIAQQLGEFLSAIHSFPIKDAAQIEVTQGWDGIHQKAGYYFLEHVAPLLSPAARKKSVACMENLLADEFKNKVIHGDFYLPDHVFFEESKHELGVIDFSDVTIYDPAHDLQCIVEVGGNGFYESVMNHYQGEKDSTLLRRSNMRLSARPLFVAGNIFANGIEDQYSSRLAYIEKNYA